MLCEKVFLYPFSNKAHALCQGSCNKTITLTRMGESAFNDYLNTSGRRTSEERVQYELDKEI